MRFLSGTRAIAFSIAILISTNAHAQILNRSDLEREIAQYEAASANANTVKMTALVAGRIWSHLGALYQDEGRFGQSEQAFEHAMRLLTNAPVSIADLAATTDALGTLYMETGNLEEAERAERKAWRMRKVAGLKDDLPLSWYHLATLFLREHKASKAQAFAEQALAGFEANPYATTENKLGSSLVLSASLCRQHKYSQAIERLRGTLPVAQETYGANSFPAGMSQFLLGYAFWKSGNLPAAVEPMQQGSSTIGRELGPDHPSYLIVMENYARLLHAEHRSEEARAIEKQVSNTRARLNADPAYGQVLETVDIAALF